MHDSVSQLQLMGGLGWRYVRDADGAANGPDRARELTRESPAETDRFLTRRMLSGGRQDVRDAAQAALAVLKLGDVEALRLGVVASFERFPQADAFPALLAGVSASATTINTSDVRVMSTAEIMQGLNDYVIGQDHAKRVLTVAVRNHLKLREHAVANGGTDIQKSNVLLVGPTGTGKTQLARALARITGVPFVKADATSLSATGYVGESVDSLLVKLLEAAKGDVKKAQFGIIYIDEIDKIRANAGQQGADVGGQGVQDELLTLIEGTVVKIPKPGSYSGETIDFDTRNVLFIAGGAFSGVDEVVRQRLIDEQSSGKSFGFGGNPVDRDGLDASLANGRYIGQMKVDDVMATGMSPEMLGRFPMLAKLEKSSPDELKRIITEPKDAVATQFKQLFAMDRITLTFDDGGLSAIADKIAASPFGARGLRAGMEELLLDTQMQLEDLAASGVRELVVTCDFVEGRAAIGQVQ